ncbi:MAG: NADP oxidoreductase [Solirubrobacterales bacterium]
MTSIDPSSAPIRIAVIGSGPAGAFTAGQLLGLLPPGGFAHAAPPENVHVDLFERLPTPWGLVRAGVAPDHAKIKTVTGLFEGMAADPRFRLYANVELGRDISVADLRERYGAIVYAVGAPLDRPLGIPGEDLERSYAATDFVGWYNGHPEYRDLSFDLGGRRAVIVGAGNVAFDVARILLLPPEELRATDIADHALTALADSKIEEVVITARRGAKEATFTPPELRELAEVDGVDLIVDAEEIARAGETLAEPVPDPNSWRNLAKLQAYAVAAPTGAPRRAAIRFFLSPEEILGKDGAVSGVRFVRTSLVRDAAGTLRAVTTGERVSLDADLVLHAVGYRGREIEGVPFDPATGIVSNEDGRVVDRDGPRLGEYAVGWAKRGPSGVIGTNKLDAAGVVDHIVADVAAGRVLSPGAFDDAEIDAFVRSRHGQVVDHPAWTRLDEHERRQGLPQGRPRRKLTDVDEMLGVAVGDA